jgi:hypothetical protein
MNQRCVMFRCFYATQNNRQNTEQYKDYRVEMTVLLTEHSDHK